MSDQIPFGEWKPDLSPVNGQTTVDINNVVPRLDGYGPAKDLEAFTEALPAPCRGFFFATKSTGAVLIFAGTSDRLYTLDNTTLQWTDASQGGSAYSAMPADGRWEFIQFNDKVVAVNQNVSPQVFDVDTDSAFADLGGSPPQAAHISVLNRFVVLSGIINQPKRVQWSALNDITGWTAGTDYSDYQDLPDGGAVHGVVGGELGVIIQEGAIRRMIYQPGSDVVFSIDRIQNGVGCIAPHTITYISNRIFFLSRRGFVLTNQNGEVNYIGREKVDRTFLAAYDSGNLGLCQSAAAAASHQVLFCARAKTEDPDGDDWTFAYVYDWLLDRWSPIDMSGECISTVAQPGFTLDSLNTIGAVDISNAANNGSGLIRLTVTDTTGWTTGDYKTIENVGGTTEANGSWTITVINGTTIDLQGSTFSNAYTSGGYVAGTLEGLGFTLDGVEAATLPALAAFGTDSKLGFYTGSNKVARLETPEKSVIASRMFVRGMYPITDANTCTGHLGRREAATAATTYTTPNNSNGQGFIPARASTRFTKFVVTIPVEASWTYATGVVPDIKPRGRR